MLGLFSDSASENVHFWFSDLPLRGVFQSLKIKKSLLTVECDSCGVAPHQPGWNPRSSSSCADMDRCPGRHVRVHLLSSASNVHFAFFSWLGQRERLICQSYGVCYITAGKTHAWSAEWWWGHGEQSWDTVLLLDGVRWRRTDSQSSLLSDCFQTDLHPPSMLVWLISIFTFQILICVLMAACSLWHIIHDVDCCSD